MIDIHNHILYGVDDGPKEIAESVEMLRDAKEQGVDAIICTPHYRHEMFHYPLEKIEDHFAKLKACAEQIGVRLFLGCEFHVNSHILDYYRNGRCRTMAGSSYVLAEYSHDTEESYIQRSCLDLQCNGYMPIIAHMERYHCFWKDLKLAENLSKSGVLLQVNADSVLGYDGHAVKSLCKKLLKKGIVDLVASDSHGIEDRVSHMEECRDYIAKKYGEDYAKQLTEGNPRKILKDAGIK